MTEVVEKEVVPVRRKLKAKHVELVFSPPGFSKAYRVEDMDNYVEQMEVLKRKAFNFG